MHCCVRLSCSQGSVRHLASSHGSPIHGWNAGFVPVPYYNVSLGLDVVSALSLELLHWALPWCKLKHPELSGYLLSRSPIIYEKQELTSCCASPAALVLADVLCLWEVMSVCPDIVHQGSVGVGFFLPLLMSPRQFCKSCGLSHTCRFLVLNLLRFLACCCCFHDWPILCFVAYLKLIE